MQIHRLTEQEIVTKRVADMRPIKPHESFDVQNLRTYVSQIIAGQSREMPQVNVKDLAMRRVEISGGNFFAHLFYSYGSSNTDLIVVYNLDAETIDGYYFAPTRSDDNGIVQKTEPQGYYSRELTLVGNNCLRIQLTSPAKYYVMSAKDFDAFLGGEIYEFVETGYKGGIFSTQTLGPGVWCVLFYMGGKPTEGLDNEIHVSIWRSGTSSGLSI